MSWIFPQYFNPEDKTTSLPNNKVAPPPTDKVTSPNNNVTTSPTPTPEPDDKIYYCEYEVQPDGFLAPLTDMRPGCRFRAYVRYPNNVSNTPRHFDSQENEMHDEFYKRVLLALPFPKSGRWLITPDHIWMLVDQCPGMCISTTSGINLINMLSSSPMINNRQYWFGGVLRGIIDAKLKQIAAPPEKMPTVPEKTTTLPEKTTTLPEKTVAAPGDRTQSTLMNTPQPSWPPIERRRYPTDYPIYNSIREYHPKETYPKENYPKATYPNNHNFIKGPTVIKDQHQSKVLDEDWRSPKISDLTGDADDNVDTPLSTVPRTTTIDVVPDKASSDYSSDDDFGLRKTFMRRNFQSRYPTFTGPPTRVIPQEDPITKLLNTVNELAGVVNSIADSLLDDKESKLMAPTNIGEVKTDITDLKTDIAEVKSDIAEVKSDIAEVKSDIDDLKTMVRTLNSNVIDLQLKVAQGTKKIEKYD